MSQNTDCNNNKKKIALIGAPTDIGAGTRGCSMGPESLRIAGIKQAIEHLDYDVTDLGDVTGPANPQQQPVEGLRHIDEVVAWNKAVKDGLTKAYNENYLPIMLGGDHCLAIGSIAAAREHCKNTRKKLFVFWLDAHADFNTSQTSPSGNIHGMPVATSCGIGDQRLLNILPDSKSLPANQVIQIGIRSVDEDERVLLWNQGVHVFDMRKIDEIGMRAVMEQALEIIDGDDVHLHVSFDADFLDPAIAPGVGTPVQGGVNYREAQLCMEMIYDSGALGSIDIVEVNPALGNKNKTAELAIELVESMLGKNILLRKKPRQPADL